MLFKDRRDAGEKLGLALLEFADRQDVLVLALPRGGVVLGYEIGNKLHVPFDLILVRKLGVPGQEELALGAIALNNVEIINKSIVSSLNISDDIITKIVAKERQELERRNKVYRQNKPFPTVNNKIVILVDDGIATGATMRAAIKVVASMQPNKIIVAAPLASASIYTDMKDEPVELVILDTPEPFYGIGMWYGEFSQLSDAQVIELLTLSDKNQEDNP